MKEGQPCDHPGCLNHLSHPCERCGRVGGREPVTLWLEEVSYLYAGMAEVIVKEPVFLLRMLYREKVAEVILRRGHEHRRGLRFHGFLISSELNDKATEFWPFVFWLVDHHVEPAIVAEGEAQWLYLQFDVGR